MTVIAYLRQCEACGVRMIVTAADRDVRLCPPCVEDAVLDIAERDDDDHIPAGQVRG